MNVTADELFSEAALNDPYPVFDRLRSDGPVHYSPDLRLHLVVGHDAINEVLGAPEIYSSNIIGTLTTGVGGAGFDARSSGGVEVLATADPPEHTGHRKLVQRTFGRGNVADLTGAVDGLLIPRISDLVGAGGGDWMHTVAGSVPVRVIGHIIGLDPADSDQLARWSDDAMEMLSGLTTPERMDEIATSLGEFTTHLDHRLDAALTTPTDGLLDLLAAAVTEATLTSNQGVMFLLQLVIAGAESTTSLIGTAARLIAERPELQASLRAEPERVGALVEEAVRVESPFRGHFRVTTRPTRLGSTELDEGDRVMLLWGAANRDPEVFERADTIDLERHLPTTHQSFGRGIHFCIGAHLARLEAQRAVQLLLDATSDVTLAAPATAYVPSLMIRRLTRLDLRTTAAT